MRHPAHHPTPRRSATSPHHRLAGVIGSLTLCLATLVALLIAPGAQAQTCSPYLLSLPKGQALYLLFPTADTTVTVGSTTYDVGDFDATDLDASLNTSDLRDRIFEIVRDAYCELSVDVKKVTSTPTPSETRWQIHGLGTDVATGSDAGNFGRSFGVDNGDLEGQDFSRTWAEQFDVNYGGTGGALNGALSTLERWATVISGTAAHEAGHNYGLNHSDADPRTGTTEDATLNHILATSSDFGSTSFEKGDNRAKRIRHFSDTSFEILGHNIGLNTKTVSNWDFVNPNDTDATSLTMRVLTLADPLNITGSYGGPNGPWTAPTITKQTGTQTFQGTTYDIWDIELSTPKSWSGGADGTVPPGVKFHVGISLSDSYIVREVTLANSSGDLPLKPRMFGYDAGTADSDSDGDFDLAFFNTDLDRGELILRDVEILFLPRPVDIEQMVVGGKLLATDGLPVVPFDRRPGRGGDGRDEVTGQEWGNEQGWIPTSIEEIRLGSDGASVPVARLSDQRHVDLSYSATGCTPGIQTAEGFIPFDTDRDGGEDRDDGEVIYCPEGPALSLFPATFTYIKATVVDPNARYWDPGQGRFVEGPLESRLFYQFAGIVPDLNDNGIDDLLDIREGRSRDENGNGVPDEVERRRYALSARIGATQPHGSPLDPGPSFNLGLEVYLTSNLTLEGTLGYHDFDVTGLISQLDAWQASLNLRLFGPHWGGTRLFVNAGAGAYFLDPGSTEAGVNAGIGLDFRLGPALELEAAYNYHDVKPGSSGFEFSTWQLGLRWRF